MIVLPGLSAGGSERVVNILANMWVERGWAVTVASFERAATASYYEYDPRVVLKPLGIPSGRERWWRAAIASAGRVRRLRAAIRDAAPDLVISFLTRTNVMVLLATAGLSIPVVVSERNNPELQAIGHVWQWLRARLYPKAFGLVTMTSGALEYFPPHMRARSWVIPNPIQLPRGITPRPSHGQLTAVGRLVPQKGFDLLLKAFARIAPRFPDWNLVIWGEGPDRERLKAERDALGLGERVRFPGVSRSPGEWIGEADVFVLSSRYEGWGIVLLEAMAAGIPAVSFDCKWGPSEMIRHEVDGLLVPGEDVDALAEAVGRMMSDAHLRDRLGAAARESARRFMPEKILAQWDEVLAATGLVDAPASELYVVRSSAMSSATRSSSVADARPVKA